MVDSLKEVSRINQSFPFSDPIGVWKESGGRVVGWACTYVPEEIIYASGALPVRVVADSKELELGDANAYLYTTSCSYTRSCLQLALEDKFDFLDGIVGAASCDGMRRLMDMWRNYISTPFNHTIAVPRKWTPWAYEMFLTELGSFKDKLEAFLGAAISDEALSEAIHVYNRGRELLAALYELRKRQEPPITGAEVLEVLNAGYQMPRQRFNELLERLLAELQATGRKVDGRFRLMVTGSILSNAGFLAGIEELGGLVVTDELCTGTRYWADPVAESWPPLEALARKTFARPVCWQFNGPAENIVRDMVRGVKEYHAEGAFTFCHVGCRQSSAVNRMVADALSKEAGIPFFSVDCDFGDPTITPQEEVQERLESFFEMLDDRK